MNQSGSPERLHHAHITVPNERLREAKAFYCEVLGLTEVAKPAALTVYPSFWIQLEGLQLHVGGEDSIVNRCESGAHLAIEVDDLSTRRARLVAAGIPIKAMVPYPGYQRFECRDPFGNRLEFISPIAAVVSAMETTNEDCL